MFWRTAAKTSKNTSKALDLLRLRSRSRPVLSECAHRGGGGGISRSRYFSLNAPEADQPDRESMAFDVLIVGGGPAGLAASIRLKQLCLERDHDLSVCLIDKGSEIGAHILSGNVFNPKALEELLPDTDWVQELQDATGSVATPVTADQFHVLANDRTSTQIPNALMPPQLHNDGNYIVSLSQLCRWLGGVAEGLGVEIYSGFAASEVLTRDGAVTGIATRDVGVGKDGQPKATFERGVALHAKQTLFCEGARGSCSEWLMKEFNLRSESQSQTYGLGLKEVWQIPAEQHQAGLVQHTLGWPLQNSLMSKTFGGSFLYHQAPDLVLVGLVVGLDYANPYLDPYQEFQRWKTHPSVASQLQNGTCLSYGARVLNEGGYHAIPKLTMPGAVLAGCGAGFLNAVQIKGSHTALCSGKLAAEACFDALRDEEAVADTMELDVETYKFQEMDAYPAAMEKSWVYKELYEVRNTHAAFQWGVGSGLVYTGLAAHITKGREPWTLQHHCASDSAATQPAAQHTPIDYPAPDNVLTFDLLTNLQRAGTYHTEDQPSHLRIKADSIEIPSTVSLPTYSGPEQRFCPAGVYEYVNDELVINAQNCIHCKCCSIKMPGEYIQWTVPEGGGGPQYQTM